MRYQVVIAVLLLCPIVLFAQTTTPATVFHSNGAFAQLLTVTPDGLEIVIQVQRGTDSSGNPSTFLTYDTFGPVPDGFVDTFASGVIPDSAFQGGDPAHLSLNIDTSQLTDFSSSSCTLSDIDFSVICGPGTVGLIQLDWKQDNFSSTHTVSNVQQTFAQFMSQQHTVADTASALVTGSFLGATISASGQTGVNHNSTLQIVKLL